MVGRTTPTANLLTSAAGSAFVASAAGSAFVASAAGFVASAAGFVGSGADEQPNKLVIATSIRMVIIDRIDLLNILLSLDFVFSVIVI